MDPPGNIEQSLDQPGKVVNPVRIRLDRKN